MGGNVQKTGFRRLWRRENFEIFGLAKIPPLFRNTWKQGGGINQRNIIDCRMLQAQVATVFFWFSQGKKYRFGLVK